MRLIRFNEEIRNFHAKIKIHRYFMDFGDGRSPDRVGVKAKHKVQLPWHTLKLVGRAGAPTDAGARGLLVWDACPQGRRG